MGFLQYLSENQAIPFCTERGYQNNNVILILPSNMTKLVVQESCLFR